VLYDVLAIGIPHVDAVSKTRAIVYRHFSLLQSSSLIWPRFGGAFFSCAELVLPAATIRRLQGLGEPKCDLAAQRPEGRPGRVFELATQDRIKPDGGRDQRGASPSLVSS
jgi:hypothetical protein